MSNKGKYRNFLPQIEENNGFFLTDAGLETVLVFKLKIDLPDFAAFPLLNSQDGRRILRQYSKVTIYT